MSTVRLALLFVLVVALSGCGASPTPELPFESPLVITTAPPAAAAGQTTPTPVPEPQPGKGSATGRFVDVTTGEPVGDRVFYLGAVSTLQAQDGGQDTPFIVMMPQSSPSASTDKDGYFAFLDVEPNTYAVLFWTPIQSRVLTDTKTEQEIMVTVEAGQTVDLGTITVHANP